MARLVFVDTETTGLDPARHEPWEIALIVRNIDAAPEDVFDYEQVWRIQPNLRTAEPAALNVNGYYRRSRTIRDWAQPWKAAADIARATDGAHLVGACPWFDAQMLERLLRDNGQCPTWHHHLIDVESLMVGVAAERDLPVPIPWKSDHLARQLGIEPPDGDARHTALGDARWVRDIYDLLVGGVRA